MMYCLENDNYLGLRVVSGNTQNIQMFSGATVDDGVNIAEFNTSYMTFYKPLKFSGSTGVQENSIIDPTTTGSTTLTTANAYKTTIITPTSNTRIVVLPNLTPFNSDNIGIWYGICNRATTAGYVIQVQYPSATTIFTIAVAPAATNGGSFAKFAVDSNGTAYYTCG